MHVIRLFSVILVFFCTEFASAQSNYNALVYSGNKAFNNKNYDKAVADYKDAVSKNPSGFASHFNLANALYKKKMYAEAEAEYKKAAALTHNKNDIAAVNYNQGNALMQQQQHEKAAELYKKALKSDPYNEAIRKNYEIAMLKDKDQKNKNQQKSGGGGGGGNDNKNKSGNSKDGKNPQQNPGSGQNNGAGNNKGNGNPQQNTGQGQNSDEMPKDLQKSLLNRIGNKEKQTANRILNRNGSSLPESNEKDW